MAASFQYTKPQECEPPLYREIDSLKDTLREVERDNTISMDKAQQMIAAHKEKISDVLATCSQEDRNLKPIHRLLMGEILAKVQIPLDILEMLVSFGFDVNIKYDITTNSKTCLHLAIANRHFGVVRWLVKYSERSSGDDIKNQVYLYNEKEYPWQGTPIAHLASEPNVPLDLFDLLKSSRNLNDSSPFKLLPLHEAVLHGRSESALHLIHIGADVLQTIEWDKLPIELYIKYYPLDYNAELFTSLIPTRGRDLLPIIGLLLERNNKVNLEEMFKMFQQLLQRLIIDWPIFLTIEIHDNSNLKVDILLNQNAINCSCWHSFQKTYLWSLLLFHLDCNMTSTPDLTAAYMHSPMANKEGLAHVQAIDDLWKKCRSRQGVHSLLHLCIQQTRHSMNSLSDSGFLTLPVPSKIHKMLLYQDIADVVCEAWRLWPQLLPMDNYT